MDKVLREKLRGIQDEIEVMLESIGFKQVEGSMDDRHLTSANNRIQVFNCPALSRAVMVYKDFPTMGKPQEHGNLVDYHKIAMGRAIKGFGVEEIIKKDFVKRLKKYIIKQVKETQDGQKQGEIHGDKGAGVE